MTFPIKIYVVRPTDARGWIGVGCYLLVLIILAMIFWSNKNLLDNDFFKVIATAIILTGWNSGPVGWAYQSTQTGTAAAASSARIAESAAGLPTQPSDTPLPVQVVNEADEPVPVETK